MIKFGQPSQAATCAPPPWTGVTPSTRADRLRAARHGRRLADPAGRRHIGGLV